MLKIKLNILWRLFFLQNSRNGRTIDGLGFLHVLSPLFKDLAVDKEDLADIAGRHTGYFNANPILASYVAGVVANLEMKKKAGEDITAERIEKVKNTLSAVLTARGDFFFGVVLVPLALTIGSIFAIYNSYIGPVIFLVFYNLYHMHLRIGGFQTGMLQGEDAGWGLATKLFREQRVLNGCAAFVSGVFSALVFIRAWDFGRTRPVVWGVLAVAAVLLLRRKISMIWTVLVLMLATLVFQIV